MYGRDICLRERVCILMGMYRKYFYRSYGDQSDAELNSYKLGLSAHVS